MRAIIIGAGRGSRLMPTTADAPKCFAEVSGQRILDWTVQAFAENGIDDICFIGGYQIEKVQEQYSQFTFRHNDNWQNNNILASLFYAEDLMDEPFICCYSDILFTPGAIEVALKNDQDIALVVDTDWLERYTMRSEHPSDDAEKVTIEGDRVTSIHRDIAEADAYGEYIGVARFSSAGAASLREHYHLCQQQFSCKPWREAVSFEKAYKILLLQEMLEHQVPMVHVDTPGGYIEIDTQQDFDYAREHWISKHLHK